MNKSTAILKDDQPMDYSEFLASKRKGVLKSGFEIDESDLNPLMFPFQKAITKWALQLGKTATFLECGLGKTFIYLEWSRQVVAHTGGKVIILTPLAVAFQTVREGEKFGIDAKYCKTQEDIGDAAIIVTNYERLHLFDPSAFVGVVLDESSILKNFTGKTKRELLRAFRKTPYKLACSATPAPNDHLELGNHADFLDVMASNEMISRWFINNSMEAGDYRLKKHAAADFWRWLTSWAVCLSKPGDLGAAYDLPQFEIPPLHVHEHLIETSDATIERARLEGRLLPDTATSATTMHKVKRESLKGRVDECVKIVEMTWGLSLTGNSAKLAVCGNQNTLNDAERNTSPTLKSAPDAFLRDEHPKRTESTCAPTTSNTPTSSKNISRRAKKSETRVADNDTLRTLNSERSVGQRQGVVIQPSSAIADYAPNLELTRQDTTQSSAPKTDAVQSADLNWETEPVAVSTLTMTTQQGLSEDYSVQPATSDLASSEIAPIYSCEPSNTSLDTQSLEPIIIWCDTDYEQRALEAAFGDYALSVYGSLSNDEKEARTIAWLLGERPILISKPSILGFGLNFQHCAKHILAGVSYSFEKTYQSLRRSWRFGQIRPVDAYMIYAISEGNIMATLKEKQLAFTEMQTEMNNALKEHGLFRGDNARALTSAQFETTGSDNWTLYLGDCVPVTATLPDNSIDFGIHSPPFANLYIYSDSDADMGNSADDAEFFDHYEFLIKDMYRVTRPGRLCAVHCKDLPQYMNRDGAAGLRDFPGEIIRRFEKHGWQYHSRVTIWKDPVIEMQRTKNHGLLHKNFSQRAEACRQGMPDYLIVFRKWPIEDPLAVSVIQKRKVGDYVGTEPPTEHDIRPGKRAIEDNYSIAVWQRYASPVWFDIDQTNVLNYRGARAEEDEKHICPLQLDVIARSIDLWTNPGETVFDPFNGIGSTGNEALKLHRKYIGIELKREYFDTATRNLATAEANANQLDLFAMAGIAVGTD